MSHNNSHYFSSLQGLRGFLSLWVFTLHMMFLLSFGMKINADTFWGEFFARIFWSGYLAVDLFFVLSGFFISYVFIDKQTSFSGASILHFWWARLARLYPVHILLLAIYAVIVYATSIPMSHNCFPQDPAIPCDLFSIKSFVKNIFLIQAWDWFPQNSWNVNSWSISGEWAAYIIAPLLILPLARIKNGYVAFGGALTFMSMMVCIIAMSETAQHFHALLLKIMQFTGNNVGRQLFADAGPAALEFGLIRVMLGFLAGCLVYKVFQSSLYAKIRWDIAGVVCVLALIAIIQFLPLYFCYLIFIPLVLSVAQPKGFVSIVLGSRVMTWMGDISYSLYMVHGLIIKLSMIAIPYYLGAETIKGLGGVSAALILMMVAFITITISAMVYYAIEAPSRQWLKSKYTSVKDISLIMQPS